MDVRDELGTLRVRLDDKRSRLVEAERRLLIAEHDQVTRLWARGAWAERAERALRDGMPFRPAAVLMADLDSFKPINDAYGHDAGDQVLSVVAERLRGSFGADALIGRWGGDEFVVLLRHVPRAQELDRLQLAIKEPIRLGDLVLNVTVSVGTAQVNERASLDALLRTADEALYETKRRLHGGGSVTQVRAVDRSSSIDGPDVTGTGRGSAAV